MVDRYVGIAQGAAGVLEDGCQTLGFYTDKIETCRPYVFVCANGTLMIHDTGQTRRDELHELLAPYGPVRAVHYVDDPAVHTANLHDERLDELGRRLGFGSAACKPVTTQVSGYAVAFSPDTGLQVIPQAPCVVRDPCHEQRETVNKLNDWFIPAGSESAPLDVQYRGGAFTPPPVTKMTIGEMLRDTREEMARDRMRGRYLGLIGVSLLYQCAPTAGHTLPGAFKSFVEDHALADLIFQRAPRSFSDPRWRAKAMAQFDALPIFTETA